MPIDDALKEIDGNEKKKEPEKTLPVTGTSSYYQKPWHEDAMKSYIAALNKNNDSHMKFDASVIELYAPWIKFDITLSSKITAVPKKRMIEVFKSRCSKETKELLESSDLNELLEEQILSNFFVTADNYYESFPDWMKFKETVGYFDLKIFEKLQYVVLVPDLDYLSIFIKDGAVLREYAKTYHQQYQKTNKTSNIIEIDINAFIQTSNVWADTLFSPELLAKFCKETGIKNIKSMVYEVDSILKKAHELMNASPRDLREVENFRMHLYEKAKKYNPDLVIKVS